MRDVQGCSFTCCLLCGEESLVPDALTAGHPDAPSAFVCERCSFGHDQYELEQMVADAWWDARMPSQYYCFECGAVTPDGGAWCDMCARYDQIYEEMQVDIDTADDL